MDGTLPYVSAGWLEQVDCLRNTSVRQRGLEFMKVSSMKIWIPSYEEEHDTADECYCTKVWINV